MFFFVHYNSLLLLYYSLIIVIRLSLKRPNRDTSCLSKDKIKQFSEQKSVAPHQATEPGILCVDVHSKDADKIVTGGVDCTAVLYDREQNKKLATLTGHSKPVTQSIFHPDTTLIATGSSDKTIRIWTAEDGTTSYKSHATFSNHNDVITSLNFHPLNEYLVSSSKDSWAFHHIERGETIASSRNSVSSPITCCSIHPDCLLLATGQENGSISLWNIAKQSVVLTFADYKKPTRALQFSENGFQILTGSDNEVTLWDLRKIKEPVTNVKLDSSFNLNSLDLTYSGAYLAACGSSIALYDAQNLDEITTLKNHSDVVTGIKWDLSGTSLASVSLDRTLKIYS